MTLYFAYGANLCIDTMARRCPDAEPIEKFTLTESKLVFRGVADCIYEQNAVCIGGLWRITAKCEAELDRFEGISSGLYRKDYVPLQDHQEPHMMLYVMNSTGIFPPTLHYADTIRRGYSDFDIPVKQLDDAIAESWDRRSPSRRETDRHVRHGRPDLAPHPTKPAPKKDWSRLPLNDDFPRHSIEDFEERRDRVDRMIEDRSKKKRHGKITQADLKRNDDLFDQWWMGRGR